MTSSVNKTISESTGPHKKIIYVDDVNYSLVSVKARLHDYYDVFPAESSLKMFEILKNIEPDLILLDINMPGVDGYETIKSLKADDRYAHIPVIFLTGNSDRESVFKGLSLGAADFIIKPISTPKLIEIIESVLHPENIKHTAKGGEADNKPSILAVDDVVSMLRAIQNALHDDYKVHVLSKSEGVIDFLKMNKPELILLDYLMPVTTGFELITRIKALPEHKETPIIILTTEGTQDYVSEAIVLGAVDFIVKPFEPKELLYKVAKHIRIAKGLQKLQEDEEKLFG